MFFFKILFWQIYSHLCDFRLFCLVKFMENYWLLPYYSMHWHGESLALSIKVGFLNKFFLYLLNLDFIFSSLGLWYVVQRTKLCLDFTCTVHLFHMFFCWYYNGALPLYFSWWVINLICVAVMCVAGEFLCMRTELRAIPVINHPKVDLWWRSQTISKYFSPFEWSWPWFLGVHLSLVSAIVLKKSNS